MENINANNTKLNGIVDFEDLLKDTANTLCFDCGAPNASWASVNNAIYLCLNCAGEHRGFGVNISYIRSINIDTWNETQLAFMKAGGNTKLNEILKLYEVNRTTTDSYHLFGSKLLEYYRNQIKLDVSGGKQLIPPKMEEALLSIDSFKKKEEEKQNKIYSVGSDFDQPKVDNNNNNNNGGFFSSMGNMLNSAIEKGKNVATNVKDKVIDMDIKTKIIDAGSKTVDVLNKTKDYVKDTGSSAVEAIKDTSSKAYTKGVEVSGIVKEKGNEIAHSETITGIKNNLNTGVNYVYGKIFGSNSNNNENEISTHVEHKMNEEGNQNEDHVENINQLHKDVIEDIVIDNQFTSSDVKK